MESASTTTCPKLTRCGGRRHTATAAGRACCPLSLCYVAKDPLSPGLFFPRNQRGGVLVHFLGPALHSGKCKFNNQTPLRPSSGRIARYQRGEAIRAPFLHRIITLELAHLLPTREFTAAPRRSAGTISYFRGVPAPRLVTLGDSTARLVRTDR